MSHTIRADLPAADHGHPRRDPAVALALIECEVQMEQGLTSVRKAAYLRIRDEELYRARGHRSFSTYLRKRWLKSYQTRSQLLKVATPDVLPAAKPIGTVSLDDLLDSDGA